MREEGDGFPDDLVGDVTGDVTGTVGCSGKKTGMGDAGLEEVEWENLPPLPHFPPPMPCPPLPLSPLPRVPRPTPAPTAQLGEGRRERALEGTATGGPV